VGQDLTSPLVPVLFKVEGGRTFGMGRVLRSLALAQEVSLLQPAPHRFFVNADEVSMASIEAAGFPVQIAPHDPDEFARSVAEQICSVLIFDQESEIKPFSDALRRRSNVRLLALDCFEMENDGLHLIVNLLNHSRHRRPASDSVAYLEGLDYAIIRAEFDEYLVRERTVVDRARRVLVSFGGADPRRNTVRVLDAVTRMGLSDLCVDVTVGPNFSDRDALEVAAAKFPGIVSLQRDPESFAALMYESDVAITGGGTTLLEAAALGIPVLVITQTEFEARFAELVERGGAAISLGAGGEQDAETIRQHLLALLDDEPLRRAMSAAGRKLVDGRGRQRLAKIALELAARAQVGTKSPA
jgi:UDP-2,4-diacetamido-2,4,6-trideoxy-beta-L-altropyranose hydrolase